jgi:alpha-N-acetylglucosamine transferase
MEYYNKYLKYKTKYLNLKNNNTPQLGGSKKKYAIINLLMISDDYLIGCITLVESIRQFKKSKMVDLICMVTPDISEEAINELKKFYDKVVLVDYIEMDIKQIKHSDEKTRKIYAKTFTKINCLKFIEYDKIVMMDVDMIVVKEDFLNIFKVKAPAVIYIGCLVFYKPEVLDLYKKIYSELKHGELVPKKYYDMDCAELYKKYNINKLAPIGIESTLCLFKPNMKDYNNLLHIVKTSSKMYKGDATLFAEYYKYKFHHLDLNYVGRWINPDDNSDVLTLDVYGFHGKVWQIENINKLIKYDDARYWMRKYIEFYEKTFEKKCSMKSIHLLYDYLKKADL